jgi:hypothetical protein
MKTPFKPALSISFVVIIIMTSLGIPLHSHPTIYKGGFVFDSMNQSEMNQATAHYSLVPRLSVGVHGLRQDLHGKDLYSLTTYTGLLLKRWNEKAFQANTYIYGGAGFARYQKQSKPAFFVGGQADIENRQWLLMGKFESMQFKKFEDLYTYTGRLGFAPYQADYDQLQGWMILQYDFQPFKQKEHDAAALVRFFYRSFLVEAGSSFRGDLKLNLMFHY